MKWRLGFVIGRHSLPFQHQYFNVCKSHITGCVKQGKGTELFPILDVFFCVFTSSWTLRWHRLINISNAATQSCFCYSLAGCNQGHFCLLWQYVHSLCWAIQFFWWGFLCFFISQYAVCIAEACESVWVWTLGLGLCLFFNFAQHILPVSIKLCCTANKSTWTWLPELKHKEKQNRQQLLDGQKQFCLEEKTLSSSASIKSGLGYPQPIRSR